MPITTNKQRLVNQVFSLLNKSDQESTAKNLPVLEQFLYAICREGVTRELADQGFLNLKDRFFDWNEVRVSSVREIA